jgi:hypothetical protein
MKFKIRPEIELSEDDRRFYDERARLDVKNRTSIGLGNSDYQSSSYFELRKIDGQIYWARFERV